MTKRMHPREKRERAEWRKLVRHLTRRYGPLCNPSIYKIIAAEVVCYYAKRKKALSRPEQGDSE